MRRSMSSSRYLARVGRLASGIESGDRASLLEDLRERLAGIPDGEAIEILGSPEQFVADYYVAADVGAASRSDRNVVVGVVLSVVLIPLGALMLLSMGGGQFIFGPLILSVGWFLARIAPVAFRAAWSGLAGLMAGQVVWLALVSLWGSGIGWSLGWPRGLAAALGIGTVVVVAVLYWRTTAPEVGAGVAGPGSRAASQRA